MNQSITLEHPFEHEGEQYSALSMRRPKVKDIKLAQAHSGSDADHEVILFANLCEVPPAAIDEMDLLDYGKLQEVYQGFTSRAGKKSGK